MRTAKFSNGSAMSLVDRTKSRRTSRSRVEKWLPTPSSIPLFLCLVLVLVLIATLPYSSAQIITRARRTGFINSYMASLNLRQQRSVDSSSACLTSGCFQIASEYLHRGNFSADPCEDFYNFACGQYEADNSEYVQESSVSDANYDLSYRLKTILESPPEGQENKAIEKVRAYYQACINNTEMNILKEKPLTDLLEQLGGWPVVKGVSWTSETGEKFDWVETIYALRNMGVAHNILVGLSVDVDPQNSSRYTIKVGPQSLDITAGYFLKGWQDTAAQKYLRYMVNTAVLLGADRDKATDEMIDAREFEIELAKSIWSSVSKEDTSNLTHLIHRMTLDELQQLAPVVNWVEFANRLLPDKVDQNEVVIVVFPYYFVKLAELIQETPKRTVANYMMWRVTSSVLRFLDDRFRNNSIEYSSFPDQMSDDPRWLACLRESKSSFSHAIGSMYVRRFLDDDARERVISLVHNVRDAFISMLKSVDWMDPTTLDKALNKAKAMEEMIAYPLEILNDTALEDYYSNITIQRNKFFESTLRINKARMDYNYGNLRKAHNRTDWRNKESVFDINASYNINDNLIQIPAGILQGVFFGVDRPRYINYGAIGSGIGHEITHGFDNTGRQFDEKGNLNGWWEPETDTTFKNKVKCMIDQYNHYNVTSVNMTVDGIQTRGENIADNGGAKASYRAYNKWAAENEEEKLLPGLSFTSRQLFWLSFANIYCSRTTPETLKSMILTDEHSPNKFRVNGVVSNSLDFSADFKCPIGSPMNPVNKCEVW